MRFVDSDHLAPLLALGTVHRERASNVEPDPADQSKWIADLSPVGGPNFGPFDLRQQALDAEVEWLKAQYLG